MLELNKTISIFNQYLINKKYYDAHEILEEVWYPLRFKRDTKYFMLKGLINASVSFELHKRGKIDASNKIFLVYLKYKDMIELYIEQYPKLEQTINIIERRKEELS
jgi:hypothetical protein